MVFTHTLVIAFRFFLNAIREPKALHRKLFEVSDVPSVSSATLTGKPSAGIISRWERRDEIVRPADF